MNASPRVALMLPPVVRLRWWLHRHLGWQGAVAAALLAVVIALIALVRPTMASQRQTLLREHVQRLDAAARVGQAKGPVTRDPRDELRDTLPTIDQRGQTIGKFLRLAAQSRVEPLRAEYVVEQQEPALSRLRISLPVTASYAHTRGFVAAILNGMPNAALDAIEMEGGDTGPLLESRLHFSLFFRQEAP